MPSTFQDILLALPPSVRRRFTSLDKYTREITIRQLGDRNLTNKRRREFLRDYLSEIQAAVLIIAVERYLEDGIRAAEGAVEIATSLDVEGFSIGSTDFSEDSPDIAAWRDVHAQLNTIIDESQLAQFAVGRHPWDFVANMLGVLIDG